MKKYTIHMVYQNGGWTALLKDENGLCQVGVMDDDFRTAYHKALWNKIAYEKRL